MIIGLLALATCGQAQAKNEYLGGNWRNCEAGHIEPYAEISKRDIEYLDNTSNTYDDEELRVGVRLRFKFGHTCNKEFRKKQADRYELEQQIELLKICRKYKSVEMGPELELVAKKCRDMKFLKKEDKRKRTDDDLFNEIMKIEHKKQMELKDNGPIKE
tara:strand:- start:112 stop:588 length:477 start_codon:yes stop_codon:yes gene_type:complete